jgi:uncharacterized protein
MEAQAVNQTYGVGPVSWQALTGLLVANENVQAIILFGSRAKGIAKNGSDIDLAIDGVFTPSQWQNLLIAIDRLELLYKIDCVNLQNPTLNMDLRGHIERVGISIWQRQSQPSLR